jgi:hypothetical protein
MTAYTLAERVKIEALQGEILHVKLSRSSFAK